jgi:glycerol-3-phosphate dehydrogenase subunit C
LMADGYVQPEFGEVKHDVAYHIPCHLRALKIGYPAAKLMAMIPGLTCHVLDDACCGLSGSYGFKQSNEASATRLGLKATGLIEKTKAQMVMADCGSCRMQLEKFSGRDVFDPVEIIYKSLSGEQLNT